MCFEGTRIPISAVWSFGAEGYSAEAIQREYPTLPVAWISDALDLVTWVDIQEAP